MHQSGGVSSLKPVVGGLDYSWQLRPGCSQRRMPQAEPPRNAFPFQASCCQDDLGTADLATIRTRSLSNPDRWNANGSGFLRFCARGMASAGGAWIGYARDCRDDQFGRKREPAQAVFTICRPDHSRKTAQAAGGSRLFHWPVRRPGAGQRRMKPCVRGSAGTEGEAS